MVVVIKLQLKFLRELANILCWLRIIISVILAITPRTTLLLAALYSVAFISDTLDGWCYRKFTKAQPCKHWFNRLPISMDPIADFCLVGGAIIHVMDDKPMGLFFVVLLMLAMIGWNIIGSNAPDHTYAVLMTLLTYFWFAMMVAMLILMWAHSTSREWPLGVVVTLLIFYTIWAKTRVRSRTIRRRG